MTHGKNICNQLNLSEEREQSKTSFDLPSRGKVLCEALKEVRKRIAEENEIPLEIEECTYKGECCGTCPHCEAEVQYLEKEMTRRGKLSKAALVAGVTLSLAASACTTEGDVMPEQTGGDVYYPEDTTQSQNTEIAPSDNEAISIDSEEKRL